MYKVIHGLILAEQKQEAYASRFFSASMSY